MIVTLSIVGITLISGLAILGILRCRTSEYHPLHEANERLVSSIYDDYLAPEDPETNALLCRAVNPRLYTPNESYWTERIRNHWAWVAQQEAIYNEEQRLVAKGTEDK